MIYKTKLNTTGQHYFAIYMKGTQLWGYKFEEHQQDYIIYFGTRHTIWISITVWQAIERTNQTFVQLHDINYIE